MAEQIQVPDTSPRPLVPYLKLTPKPHLVGSKCGCGTVYLELNRMACSKCFAAGPFPEIKLSDHGKVYVFSVVHQSFPGIKTPYITAIVDLPEGVSVRATLVDISPEELQKNPKTAFDLPVELVTSVVAKDREGHDVIGYAYRPCKH
jgi:uncharacterized OB-fold protein